MYSRTGRCFKVGCKYCPTHFKDTADLSKHVVLHLRNYLYRQLPDRDPFKCPNCDFVAPQRITLLIHFGTGHAAGVWEDVPVDRPEFKARYARTAAALRAQEEAVGA